MKYKSALIKEQRKYSKAEYGPDCTVSNTKFSSVNLNELAVKARVRKMVIYSLSLFFLLMCLKVSAREFPALLGTVRGLLKGCES